MTSDLPPSKELKLHPLDLIAEPQTMPDGRYLIYYSFANTNQEGQG